MSAAGYGKRKSPPPNGGSPDSKRARLDSPVNDSAAASPAPSFASSLSYQDSPHRSSPEVELSLASSFQHHQAGKTAPVLDGQEEDDSDAEGDLDLDLGLVDDDDDDDMPLGLLQHHTLSAKSVPTKQPRPSDILGQRNGNGQGGGGGGVAAKKAPPPNGMANGHGGRPMVGGKGKRGEEQIEHAVAAREETERRRAEMGKSTVQGASKALPGVVGAIFKSEAMEVEKEDEPLRVKLEEDEVVVVPEEEDPEPIKRERPAVAEERDGVIQFKVVTNDGDPVSLIILTGLKNIFQKQLPKMPKEYIARLVYDRNHYSMAIVKRGWEVVGGVTYRPFEARRFAEIVFFAITGTEQVKGYGQYLMNHLKAHVKLSTQCMHFLTYADNYAIGYFKKQGFTKEVGLDRSVWAGYIKDYEGGTIMHCAMLERIDYLKVADILTKQKEVILQEIRLLSQSHVVHKGLDIFNTLAPGASLDPALVPGLKESGWTPEMDELTRRPKRSAQFAFMEKLLLLLNQHPSSWAFTTPVNAAEVTDYYDVIKNPMDLATMDRKLEANAYDTLDGFVADAKLIFSNCRAYNDPGSNYVKNADKLERFLNEQVRVYRDLLD